MGKKKKKPLSGVPHKKTRLAQGVELEYRHTIGFAPTPVQERATVDGFPIRYETDFDYA